MQVSGHGTVNHPVTGAAMRTTVFEVEGLGRVGEWLDYGNDEAGTVAAIAAADSDREALRECLEALRCGATHLDPETGDEHRGDAWDIFKTLRAAITTAEKALGDV